MNTRAQASLAHQGRPARQARAIRREVVTLAISDVPGDDPAVIGSGPTVPDPTTLADARAIVARYRLDLPDAVTRALDDPATKRRSPATRSSPATDYRIVARPADALAARPPSARSAAGYECVMLGDRLQGEAREVAAEHARLARELARRRAGARSILSGGELTVTLRGKGRGGPNQEYALALAIHLGGAPGHRRARRRYRRNRRRRRPPGRPGRRLCRCDHAGARPRRSASIPPRFSPTTIPRGFSMPSAICSGPVRPSPTSPTSAPSSLTGHENSTRNLNRT